MIDVATIDETTVNGFRPGYDVALVQHLMKKFGWSSDLARRVLRDAIRFFAVSAIPPSSGPDDSDDGVRWEPQTMVSSELVDCVVDEIFLNTPLLVWLETEVLHVRMHHVPSYEHGIVSPAIGQLRYEFTVSMMQAAGYELDDDIWPAIVAERPCSVGGGWNDCLVHATR